MNASPFSNYVPNLTGTPLVGDIWVRNYGFGKCLEVFYVVTKITEKMVGLSEINDEILWEAGETDGMAQPIFPTHKIGQQKMFKLKSSPHCVKMGKYSHAFPWNGIVHSIYRLSLT